MRRLVMILMIVVAACLDAASARAVLLRPSSATATAQIAATSPLTPFHRSVLRIHNHAGMAPARVGFGMVRTPPRRFDWRLHIDWRASRLLASAGERPKPSCGRTVRSSPFAPRAPTR